MRGSKPHPPPQTWKVDAACGHRPVYVDHQGYATVIGVDHPGIDLQGKHRHLGDRPPGDALEGRGGHHRYPPPCHHPVSRFTPWVPRRERNGDGDYGAQTIPGALQHRPRPPLPSITQSKEGIRHGRLRMPHQELGRIRRRTTDVQYLCNLLVPPGGCHKTERVTWT